MQRVPARPQSRDTTVTGVMIAEAIDNRVPNWAVLAEEGGLAEWDPDVAYWEPPHREIRDVEVRHRSDAVGMLADTIGQGVGGGVRCDVQPASSACGHRLADVD